MMVAAACVADAGPRAPLLCLQGVPMFLYLPFQGAHSGDNQYVQAPADYITRFDALSPNATCGQWEPTNSGNCTKPAMRKSVAALVSTVDDAVAAVLSALKAANM
jgi:hypothetical protein